MYFRGECINKDTNRGKYGVLAHHFVVIMDAVKPKDRTLLFPLCTIPDKRLYNKTTIIYPSEHVFVKSPTYIDYELGLIISVEDLDKLFASGVARRKEPRFTEEFTQKVADGILKTDDIPFIFQSFYEDYLLK